MGVLCAVLAACPSETVSITLRPASTRFPRRSPGARQAARRQPGQPGDLRRRQARPFRDRVRARARVRRANRRRTGDDPGGEHRRGLCRARQRRGRHGRIGPVRAPFRQLQLLVQLALPRGAPADRLQDRRVAPAQHHRPGGQARDGARADQLRRRAGRRAARAPRSRLDGSHAHRDLRTAAQDHGRRDRLRDREVQRIPDARGPVPGPRDRLRARGERTAFVGHGRARTQCAAARLDADISSRATRNRASWTCCANASSATCPRSTARR